MEKQKRRRKQHVCVWSLNWQAVVMNYVFSIEEKGFLMTFIPFLKYRDNTIRFFNDKPARQSDMAIMSGYSVAQTRRLLKSLEEKNAIKRINGAYVINPCLCWKGTELDQEYKELMEIFILPLQENTKVAPCGASKKSIVSDVYGHKIPLLKCSSMSGQVLTGERLEGTDDG